MSVRIISGGQTGVDRIALDAARKAGLQTGGTAPRGYLTENGPDPSLREFGLADHRSPQYPPRTKQNIVDSDVTVLFTNNPHDRAESLIKRKGGSALTLKYCKELGKQCLVNPSPWEVLALLCEPGDHTINFAGTRGSLLEKHRADSLAAELAGTFTETKYARAMPPAAPNPKNLCPSER